MVKTATRGVTALVLLLLAGTAAATVRPRIAVMGLSVDNVAPDVREKLDAAVAGGLAASGAEVVAAAQTAKKIAEKGMTGCETSTCLAGVAQALGARYLIRGHIGMDGRNYAVRLEMIDGASGGVVEIREDRCEICTENEAYEAASVAASALKAAVSKRNVALAAGELAGRAGPPLPAGAPLAGDPGAGAIGASSSLSAADAAMTASPAPAARGRRFGALSWVGVGAGVVAIGTGIFLLSIDGDGTCSHAAGELCESRYQTKAGGITLIGVGALAAAAGAALLVGRF
jgi:hypothetical protein